MHISFTDEENFKRSMGGTKPIFSNQNQIDVESPMNNISLKDYVGSFKINVEHSSPNFPSIVKDDVIKK